jgi:hypothetical protein
MRTLLIAASLLALSACGAPQDTGPAMPEDQAQQATPLELTCAVFAGATLASVIERYGAENVTTETVPGPEGEDYQATILYAADPARRIELVWSDAGPVANVTARSANSTWVGTGGVSMGMLLPELERINGASFKLWGFGWDYGGWVSDWNGGALRPANGCMTRVQFEAANEPVGAMGDSEFQSDNAAVRRASPRVVEIGLAFSTE